MYTSSCFRYPKRDDQTNEQDPLYMRTIYSSPDEVTYPSSIPVSSLFPKIPVGIALDKGSPHAYWGSGGATSVSSIGVTSMTKECYGLGTCGGLEGHWICSKFTVIEG